MEAIDPTGTPTPSPSPTRKGRALWWAGGVLGLLAVVLAGAAATLWWTLHDDRGTAWLLSRLPGVEVVHPRGSLIGDFGAESVVVQFGDGGEVRLAQVAWQQLAVGRTTAKSSWLRVSFDRLEAQEARFTSPKPTQTQRTPPPQQLSLPVELVIGALRIGTVHADALDDEPLHGLEARIHLGADQGRLHRVESLAMTRGALQASGHLRVGALAPMNSDVAVDLQQAAVASWPAWGAQFKLTGALAKSNLTGRLATQTKPAQALNIDAVVQPFAQWPLAQLNAQFAALDVAALLGAGPHTALNGNVVVQAADADKPLDIRVDLTNAAAGSWNAGRVPARRVQLVAAADPRESDKVNLNAFNVDLGTAEHPAGTLTGDGLWTTKQGWRANIGLKDVRAQVLDARAPSTVLAGSVRLIQQQSAVNAGQSTTGQTVQVEADIAGQLLDGASVMPVALKTQGRLVTGANGALAVELKNLVATSGDSKATAHGSARRDAATAPWRTEGRLAAADFDLRPWWPGVPGRSGPRAASRLTASADFQLTLFAATATKSLADWVAGVQGQADLRVAPSVLAGVPVQGELSLRAAGNADGVQVSLRADAAGNTVNAKGRLLRDATQDHWDAAIHASALKRLAPLVQAFVTTDSTRSAPAVSGALTADLRADGRWPHVQTSGQLDARNVIWPGLRLRQADARWKLGTAPDAALAASATVRDLLLTSSEQARRVSVLTMALQGTAKQHSVDLLADLAAAPPAWTRAVQGASSAFGATRPGAAGAARTRVKLAAQGGVLHEAQGGPLQLAGWRGRVAELDMRRAEGGAPLVRTSNVDLSWRAASAAQPARLDVQPARVEVLGGAVRWSRLAWQAGVGQTPAQVDVDATLEPVRVGELLARLQPALGWSGDLEVAGRVQMHTAPTLRADILLERQRGDLQLVQGSRRRSLGLKELRVAVRAQGRQWNASARMAGQEFGAASADVTARTTSTSPWPSASTPMDGRVDLRVADLGIYSSWLPVGWRIGGQFNANARLGGQIGAPQYTGTLNGRQLAISNLVEGVQVRDGDLLATLNGARGRIDRFTARAGDGSLRVTGGAEFGAQPHAQLTLVAERFRALGRVDRRIDVSGRADVRMTAQQIALQGKFVVDEGLVDLGRSQAPELSTDVRVVDAPTPGRPVKAKSTSAPKLAVRMDVQVRLGDQLRIRGKGINTLLAGDLRVQAPAGQITINGTVRTVEGSYNAYAQELRIERGLITFVGPVANPRLDIQAIRPDLRDVEVGVAITGTAQDPRVRLFATPEMSELDKLSWLTLGRPSAGLASDQSALLHRAAMALLAGQRGSSGGDGIAQKLGLDAISVKRGESGGLSDAVVSLGKQVSERFYVGYAQSLDATGGSWELIYEVARRLTVRVQTGEATAVDLVWTWLWG